MPWLSGTLLDCSRLSLMSQLIADDIALVAVGISKAEATAGEASSALASTRSRSSGTVTAEALDSYDSNFLE